MALPDFYGRLTLQGEAAQADALSNNTNWALKTLCVGDGQGAGAEGTPIPNKTRTTLVHERDSVTLNKLYKHPQNPGQIIAEGILPPEMGGFWVREVGIKDENGKLLVIANCPPSFKPLLAAGSGRVQVVRVTFRVTDPDSLVLMIDPSTVIATVDWAESTFLGINDTAVSAKQLSDARIISATGDGSWEVAFDGSENASANFTLATTGVNAGNYTKVKVDEKGRVTEGTTLSAADIPALTLAKISDAGTAAGKNIGIRDGEVPEAQMLGEMAWRQASEFRLIEIQLGAHDLNTITEPGDYYQPANNNALPARNYPVQRAGALSVYRAAGIVQVYRIYDTGVEYHRTLYSSVWSGWAIKYSSNAKPSAADIGALPAGGTAVAASKLAAARTINGVPFDGTVNISISAPANGGTSAACSGNSATASRLATARTINGVAFDGTANISIPSAAPGDIGSYVFAANMSTVNKEYGDNIAGGSLSPANPSNVSSESVNSAVRLSGSWRCAGRSLVNAGFDVRCTNWYRIA